MGTKNDRIPKSMKIISKYAEVKHRLELEELKLHYIEKDIRKAMEEMNVTHYHDEKTRLTVKIEFEDIFEFDPEMLRRKLGKRSVNFQKFDLKRLIEFKNEPEIRDALKVVGVNSKLVVE